MVKIFKIPIFHHFPSGKREKFEQFNGFSCLTRVFVKKNVPDTHGSMNHGKVMGICEE